MVSAPVGFQQSAERHRLQAFRAAAHRLWRAQAPPKLRQTGGVHAFNQPSPTLGPYDRSAPRVAADVSTPARRTAVAIEDSIRSDTLETGVFIGPDGLVLLRRKGLPSRVTFSQGELSALAGSTFTHNHLGANSFSVEDVVLASEFELEELRVVTPGHRYGMRGFRVLCPAAWHALFDAATAKAMRPMAEDVRLGLLNRQDFGAEVLHLAWQIVAHTLDLHYWRERS